MTFTDDDLNRLREQKSDSVIVNHHIIRSDILKALLARLEAAEISDQWARTGHLPACTGGFSCTCPFLKSRAAWVEACGKGNSLAIYRCANPDTCPHPLHRMTIGEYESALKNKAIGKTKGEAG